MSRGGTAAGSFAHARDPARVPSGPAPAHFSECPALERHLGGWVNCRGSRLPGHCALLRLRPKGAGPLHPARGPRDSRRLTLTKLVCSCQAAQTPHEQDSTALMCRACWVLRGPPRAILPLRQHPWGEARGCPPIAASSQSNRDSPRPPWRGRRLGTTAPRRDHPLRGEALPVGQWGTPMKSRLRELFGGDPRASPKYPRVGEGVRR
jgi:hypothetical protein